MSLKIALTGGIGSGKTTVANMFLQLGIPIYHADARAAALQDQDPLRAQIVELLGPGVYATGKLKRKKVARMVFGNPPLLQSLNQLVHPAVASDYEQWLERQNAPYTLKEAAIIFETGSQKAYHKVILVRAPLQERIERVVKRDGATPEEVTQRINQQWSDEKKAQLADYVIDNLNIEETERQVARIHQDLLTQATLK